MCTATSFKDNYFGRNLDYEFSYGEKIVIVPRKYVFNFKHLETNCNHYAIIGMAHVVDNYPLFYDAMNEHGLAIAGLNFVNNAFYNKVQPNKKNIAQFEFISYILANYKNIEEIILDFNNFNIVDTQYNNLYPTSSLHWIVKDMHKCIVIESTKDGLFYYENKLGILTNNPPFNYQMENLKNYKYLSNKDAKKEDSIDYSRGKGAVGLPGDLSSKSRFVRVAFTTYFSIADDKEEANVNQFFHILDSVNQTRGCCKVNDKYEITIYSSCMNLKQSIYYYKTYDNFTINGIKLKNENLDTTNLITFEIKQDKINYQN